MDLVKLERVEKRFTMLPGHVGFSYWLMLSGLRLFSLERRRCLYRVYKIMRGMGKENTHSVFPGVVDTKTRGHKFV